MRIRPTLVALLLTTSLAQAQAISPLGGSTNNAGSPPPALATPTARPTPMSPAPTSPATTTPSPAATAPIASRAHARRTMDERFAAANTTKDGKLTLDQAKAGHLRAVARDFAAIDKTKRGYVTLDDIKTHQSDQRAARKAAREAKKP